MDDLAKNLASAQSALDTSAESVKPSGVELQAISSFCKEEVRRRALEDAASDNVKLLRVQQKSLRNQLTKDLGSLNSKCIAISKEDSVRLEALAKAAKIDSMNPYMRLVSVNKDASITPEVIQEALESVTDEDLKEAAEAANNATDKPEAETTDTGASEKADKQATIRALVLTNIRRIIRSYTETLKMSESLPRGLSIYDVTQASTEIADKMWTLWTTELAIKDLLAKKKASASKQDASLKTQIEAFFIRTGLTAQRIVVEGHPYRLVRRVSVRKAKIGVGRFEQILDEILGESKSFSNFKPIDFMKSLQIQLSSVPPEMKSTVVLCKIAED